MALIGFLFAPLPSPTKLVFSGFAKVSTRKSKFVVLASLVVFLERLLQIGEKSELDGGSGATFLTPASFI